MKDEIKEELKEEIKKEVAKQSNTNAIIMTVLILLVLALTSYVVYDKFLSEEPATGVPKVSAPAGNKDDNKTTPPEPTSTPTTTSKEIDLTKCINSKDTYTNPTETTSGDLGLSATVNADKKSITLKVDWKVFGEFVEGATSTTVEEYQITGFTKNVSSVFIGEIGQDAKGTKLVYLMEDGTLAYTSLFTKQTDASGNSWYDAASWSNLKVDAIIEDATDVVKLYNANGSDSRTVLAAKNDGSFYDIGKIINK